MSLKSGYGSTAGSGGFLPSGGGGSAPSFVEPQVNQSTNTVKPGGFAFDFTQPTSAYDQITGSGARLVNSVPGGNLVTGAIGGLGSIVGGIGDFLVPGDLGVGDIAQGVGSAIGFLNYERNKATARDRINGALGQQSGLTQYISGLASGIGQFFSPVNAEAITRLRAQALGKDPNAAVEQYKTNPVPDDILGRARNGESVDALAQEMADKGIGTSSNQQDQMASDILADPLNLVSFGLGKVATTGEIVKVAAAADRLGEVNPILRASGTIYNGLAAGGNAAVKSVVTNAFGPATSGILKAYNAGRYNALLKAIDHEGPDLRRLAEQFMATNHLQSVRAVIGKSFGQQWEPITRELRAGPQAINEGIIAQAKAAQASGITAKLLESDVEGLIREVKFQGLVGLDDGAVYEQGMKMLTQTLGVSAEGAARILGSQSGKALKETVSILRGMRYGKAVNELVKIKNALSVSRSGSLAVQAERLTPLAEGTLTDKRAAEALDAIVTEHPTTAAAGLTPAGRGTRAAAVSETFNMEAVHAAVERYDVLRTAFLGKPYTADAVVTAIRALQRDDNLVTELTSGLPRDLADWADTYGYGVGYAPKSGWKATLDDAGNVHIGDAFVHVQSGLAPTRFRNPIGRLGDSLFAAIHQRQLVLSSEFRLGDAMVSKKLGTEADARIIHRTILNESFERKVTPRGLIDVPATSPTRFGKAGPYIGNRIQEIFADRLGDRYQELVKVANPEFLFLDAIKGNVGEVGYSQWLTGWLKSKEVGGLGTHVLTSVTEDLYPKARFVKNPFFQAQERVETVFYKVIRGVVAREIDPAVRDAINAAVEGSPQARTFEEFGSTFLHGGDATVANAVEKSGVGARLRASLTNVQGSKHDAVVAQVVNEYPEQFAKILIEQEPKLWAQMLADGGGDARTAIDKWLTEHMALTSGADPEALLNEAKTGIGGSIERTMAEGDTAASQTLNKEVGIARGGTVESGGAIKPNAPKPVPFNPDEETIWQAWRYAIRRTSDIAKQTQYFREGRGWLERSLNHPFLGLYPLSYASKVFMEFGRFLLKRPFGLNAPLAGAAAMNKFQQAVLVEMGDPKSAMAKFVKQNPIIVNLVNQMLPYWPTQISVNAPLWVKDIAGQAERGKALTPAERTAKNANVTPGDFGKAIWDQSALYLTAPLRLPVSLLQASDQAIPPDLGSVH